MFDSFRTLVEKRVTTKSVYLCVHGFGPISKTGILEKVGGSLANLNRFLDELEQAGLVTHSRGSGRRAGRYTVVSDAAYAVGGYVNNDVIGIGCCDIAGNVSNAAEVFFEDIRTPQRALEFFTDTFHTMYTGEVKNRCLGSAIAITGPVDRRAGKLLAPVNLPGWSDLPLRKLLEEAFGIRVAVELFAEAILLGELFFNNHDIDSRIVLLWLDDGIGAGISDKGRMNLDQTDRTSILGHQVVDFNGVPCGCGKRGCLLGYGSIPGFMRYLRSHLDIDDERIEEANARFRGDPWHVSRDLERIELAKGGRLRDTFENYALEELDRAYFAGLSNVINVLRSDRIVFSGRLAHRYRERFERIIGNVVETSMFFGGHTPRIEWKDLDSTELIRGGAARVFNEFINLVE